MSIHSPIKTRQLSLVTAFDVEDAVFTFHKGTPPHTTHIMTTTNFNTPETIQELSDAELEQINGGFFRAFFRWVARAFRRAPRTGHQNTQWLGRRRVDSFDYTEVNL